MGAMTTVWVRGILGNQQHAIGFASVGAEIEAGASWWNRIVSFFGGG